jgi:hypothetical protein
MFLQEKTIDDEINGELVLLVSIIVLISCATLAIIVWQIASTWRSRMPAKHDAALLRLTDEATAAQSATSEALGKLASEVKSLNDRLFELERLLRSVE